MQGSPECQLNGHYSVKANHNVKVFIMHDGSYRSHHDKRTTICMVLQSMSTYAPSQFRLPDKGRHISIWTNLSTGEEEGLSQNPLYQVHVFYYADSSRLRSYTRGLMEEAHRKGTPVMRPLFYEFPEDAQCWAMGERYMFGAKYLCAPVMRSGVTKLSVYLPDGARWKPLEGGGEFVGGQRVEVDCPLDYMPVFNRIDR
ncbi:hypothetical protein VTK56DRAFT_998 [Thermocarpiscus australiensis]